MAPPTSKKKRKLHTERSVPQQPKKRAKTSGRIVDVDKLPWKEVRDLPEMFNDAEGFYGLQVIDGVDVVRRDNGAVEFVANLPPSDGDELSGLDDTEEFLGFDDEPAQIEQSTADDDVQENSNTEAKTSSRKEKREGGKESRKKKQRENAPATEHDTLEENVFSAVDNAADVHEDTDMSEWMQLNLSPQVVSSIALLKFSKPTAIQEAAIPEILEGRDVIGKASTGSGKTLAFAIPIVEKWLEMNNGQENDKSEFKVPIALILSPTRELAHQITNHIKNLCAGLPTAPYVCSVTGGLSLQKQQRQLRSADIVIGTPGRLWEVLSSNSSLLRSFRQTMFLVVDEADRLLTEGHFKEAQEIFDALDRIETGNDEETGEQEERTRQTLVFSATFNKNLQQKLAGKGKYDLMNNSQSMEYLLKKLNFREKKPKFIDVNPVSQMAEKLKEGLIECGPTDKDLYLYAVLLLNPNKRTLIFTNSISAVRRLTPMLQNLNLTTNPLHSQMIQKARLRSVERFTAAKSNTASILVATDVAARGLDIPGVDQVIHYHVPRTADMYVHRSGRTARAEQSGVSVILCAPEEVVPTRRLAAKVHLEQAGEQRLIKELDVDRKLVARLKPRLELAKKIADAYLAKEKGNKDEDWMKKAADDLGVEYDEDIEKATGWGGRGSGRKDKETELRRLTKRELGMMKAQLRELLGQRINAGVSTRYLTGRSDVDELLAANSDFLGKVDGLGFDED